MKNFKNKTLFGDITISEFLRDYWHKKPLLVKNFYSNPEKLATIENLIDMAKDENFESRIIYPPNESENWVAKEGPLDDKDLKKKEWTLAVHGLDLYFKEFHNIQSLFDFIPKWQFDDIMATYSLPGTGVGAHIDNYDVFIFQGKGKRKWCLDTNPNPEYIEGIDIKILKEFNTDIEWILEPGDMVYLPPRIAHHGITLEESISYSIGFKAEDSEKILNNYAMQFLSEFESSDFISHPPREKKHSPYYILPEELKIIKEHMIDKLFDDEVFNGWAQSYLSRPRSPITEGEDHHSFEEIMERINQGEELYKDPNVKFNFIKDDDDITLYISTLKFFLRSKDYVTLEPILCTPSFNAINLTTVQNSKELQEIIKDCIKFGVFYFN